MREIHVYSVVLRVVRWLGQVLAVLLIESQALS